MKQFTDAQIQLARQRVTPEIVNALIARNREVIDNDILVPETGCATWNHYFFCPNHSVRLIWDRHSPGRHRCPIDGATFSGEPYDGAWWRWLNGLNARACYELAVLWLLTDDPRWLEKVVALLMRYAQFYPDYEEHGGIPYNGPGKANAQTLCEANCHADFARGFDIIRAQLTQTQERYIAERLLCCGAEFLMAHRCNQIHNHEVKISATIGIIGVVLGNDRYLDFAVRSQYGLQYQLEHGLSAGGLWFEGSVHYHYYALEAFFAFEKVAQGSRYSLLEKPWYRRMLSVPLQLLLPDMTFPAINDCVKGQERPGHPDIYEFAWQVYRQPEYGELLSWLYSTRPRDNIDALFYGVALPAQHLQPPEGHLHAPDLGLTLIRTTPGDAVCINHLPYGGEHDHYASLDLIVYRDGKPLLPDLGTTGYGAPLHYGYYKNTFSHSTLCVNGKNQPPSNPQVVNWAENSAEARLVAEVDWRQPITMPDSKTRVEWDDVAYQDVSFRRHVVVTDRWLIDVHEVDNPHQQQVDSVWHLNAAPAGDSTAGCCFPHVQTIRQTPLTGAADLFYAAATPLHVHCFSGGETTLIQARGPDNPSTSDLAYVILRASQRRIVHVCVFDFTGSGEICVGWENGTLRVEEARSGYSCALEVNA
ncbi:heparinase II/III domain-containing protein [Trabulsiella odontotermitis]|uniref:heparinase II/III domain-containing protein n=1 Tax=Trabulsiella odontotermitis TaxID=379893 RepID=UPI003AD731DB